MAGGDWLAVGRVVRSRGNRGEVIADAPGMAPERFTKDSEFYLFRGEELSGDGAAKIERAWEHQGKLILKFAGVDSIGAAEKLRGLELRIRKETRPAAPEDEFYLADLVGCDVIDRPTGEKLGVVKDWRESSGPVLLEVVNERGEELLVPFARTICAAIDVAARRIEVVLPEGLKDLNRP